MNILTTNEFANDHNMVFEGQARIIDMRNYVASWIRNTSVDDKIQNLNTASVLNEVVDGMIIGLTENIEYEEDLKKRAKMEEWLDVLNNILF